MGWYGRAYQRHSSMVGGVGWPVEGLLECVLPFVPGFCHFRRSGLVISREQGLRNDAGFAVPVLMS